MINETPGIPSLKEMDIWLNIHKGLSATSDDVIKVIDYVSFFYYDQAVREKIIKPLAERSQRTIREQNAIQDDFLEELRRGRK